MIVNGEEYPRLEVYPKMMTVPDCIVKRANKLGRGNGEAKLYVASKDDMYGFYGDAGFSANCFMLKSDLINYMNAVKNEYFHPSQDYAKKDSLPFLWAQRMNLVLSQDEVITFSVQDQTQIVGPRGYVNSSDKGYDLIRELALPLVSYIYVEKLGTNVSPIFYWKLLVDFETIWQRQSDPLVFTYGRRAAPARVSTSEGQGIQEVAKQEELRRARVGQGKYREALLEQCPYCPVTMISDERLLIASHIKPWAASDDDEKLDPYNGFMLSPMIDKLFDRGFITFTKDRRIILSEFISNRNWNLISLRNKTYYQMLPMDEHREQYLEFHHDSVFKGNYEAC